MAKLIYKWQRYWYPPNDQVLLTPDGFLYVLHPSLRGNDKSQLVQLHELADSPCLILLGEPGLGKSISMQKAYGDAKETAASTDEYIPPFLDLKRYGEVDLASELDKILERCRKSASPLPLFIDSLDEARLRVETVADMLIRRLEQSAGCLQHLRLRIACREGEWLSDFEAKLRCLWASQHAGAVNVFVLAPLREEDVRLAVTENELDPSAFMREVRESEVGLLAATPSTLNLLLQIYSQHQRLVGTRYELYRQGCAQLCRESDYTHETRDLLDPEQQLLVAGRLAACTILTNRPAISVDSFEVTGEASASVTVAELAGGIENIDGIRLSISEKIVRETLETALFAGSDSRVWAHRTYGEFLAAWYVHQRLTTRQIRNLLFHTDGRLVPQLRGTAVWLAGMNVDLLSAIVQSDPEVALRSDNLPEDTTFRAKLAGSLLQSCERVVHSELRLYERYAKLKHPGMPELLRPYLTDKGKPLDVRVMAVDMVEVCEVRELLPELALLSLDDSEADVVRLNAAHAVVHIGDDSTKTALRPLVWLPEDPTEPNIVELKYYAIEATWPAHISASELFDALKPSSEEETILHGTDLAGLVVPHLTGADYSFALDWVARQPRTHEMRFAYGRLADAIVLRSWEHVDLENVAEAFVTMVANRLLQYNTIVSDDRIFGTRPAERFVSMVRNDTARRHAVLALLFEKLVGFAELAFYLIQSRTPLVFSEDLPWLIEQFTHEETAQTRVVVANLISQLNDARDAAQNEVLYAACKANPVLDKALGFPFDAVPLESPQAVRGRQYIATRKKWESEAEERQGRELLHPVPREYVLDVLETCEADKPEEWWRVSHAMILESDGRATLLDDSPNLEDSPVWRTLDDQARARVLSAARKYLEACDLSVYDWFGSQTTYHPVVAGYRAFWLILNVKPALLSDLTPEIWSKWSPVLVYYASGPYSSRSATQAATDRDLLCHAYRHARSATTEAILRTISLTGRQKDCFRIEQIEGLLDPSLAQAILPLAQDPEVTPVCRVRLLGMLVAHDYEPARILAKSLIRLPLHSDTRGEAVAVASVLALKSTDAGWDVIWPAIQQDVDFGRELIKYLAYPMGRNGGLVGSRLSELHLADLYFWLVCQFPDGTNPRLIGFHQITIEEDIAYFKDAIRGHLRDRGTQDALRELQRIARELPDQDFSGDLAHLLELVRNRTWRAPGPREVMELVRDRNTGLVESREQLLDLVIESLGELHKRLHDQHAAVYDLWNDVNWSQVRHVAGSLPDLAKAEFAGPKDAVIKVLERANWKKVGREKIYLPKDEEHLSDYIARYLREVFEIRGIVINREVQVRRDRTDIHINTFKRTRDGTAFDPIITVIEVKGCWNPALSTAMQTQLADRYLRPLGPTLVSGLYLVGAFDCAAWFLKDPHRSACRRSDISAMQVQFDQQAEGLSRNGLCIRAYVLDARLP